MIGLTATADPQTRGDILDRLGLQQARCFVAGFDRPNIRYSVVEKLKPFNQLAMGRKKFVHIPPKPGGTLGLLDT